MPTGRPRLNRGRDFSKEIWDEIYAARERLEAYKRKIQPYDAEPEDSIEPEIKPIFRPRPIDKEVDQLKAEVTHLRTKVAELRSKKESQGQY